MNPPSVRLSNLSKLKLLGPTRPRLAWPDRRLAEALAILERRVRGRYWLESLRLALIWGGAAAAALLTLLRLTPLAAPEKIAALGGGLIALAVLALRFRHRPDALAVAHIADALSLKGRAITAFRLLQKESACAWEQKALAECLAACRALPAEAYALIVSWRPWRNTALVWGLFLALMLTPNPLQPYWEARQEEQRALAAAAEQVKQALAPLEKLRVEQKPLLDPAASKELGVLSQKIREAGEREKAVAELLQARRQLEAAAGGLNPTALEDAARLANLWQEADPALSAALQQGEAEKAEKAFLAWWQKAASGAKNEREQAALQLFRSAEAVKDPALRKGLREAARYLNQDRPAGEGQANPSDMPDSSWGEAVARSLASLAEHAGGSAALAGAATTLNRLAAALSSGAGADMLAQAGNGARGSSSPGGSPDTCPTSGNSGSG
ncbi:MAG: hypothetical protein PWP65_1808 [Clostridia bacterium]|nr:hypothetical protein [Clostridia bacterium]